MDTQFILHPQLANDTFPICSLEISDVLLMNDSRYPWLILVPRCPNVSDITDLSDEIRLKFSEEINNVATVMKQYFQPERMNIAMLGNIVPQLHCHIIARFKEDFAWAKPVWGIGDAVKYEQIDAEKTMELFRNILGI